MGVRQTAQRILESSLVCLASEEPAGATRVAFPLSSFFTCMGLVLVIAGVILARKLQTVDDDEDPAFFSMGGRKPTGKLLFAIAMSVLGGVLALVGMFLK